MAARVIFYIILILNCFVLNESGVTSDLYCKDPDSDKFYPIDTTWSSSNLCQRYTCKLRKRNIDPINLKLNNIINIANNNNEGNMLESPSQIVETFIKPENEMTFDNNDSVKLNNKENDSEDRYLTEEEINTITKILHTAKKSELQSVIDIYNLAQEIYKDMDSANTEKVTNYYANSNTPQNYNNNNYAIKANWFNPYNIYNQAKNVQSNYISNVVPKILAPQVPQLSPQQYYGGTSPSYYYPTQSYQRSSSYNYPLLQRLANIQPNNQIENPCPPQQSPCQSAMTYSAPWINRIMKQPLTVHNQQTAYPSAMQYPYSYVYRYNNTYPSEVYFNKIYWSSLSPDYVKSNTEPGTQILTYKNNVMDNKESKETRDDNDEREKEISDDQNDSNKLPEWQTEQLSPEVLEDIKANWDKPIFTNTILDNFFDKSLVLPNPLKKPVKLEKVGTVIRLDDEEDVARDKRYVEGNFDKKTAEQLFSGEHKKYTFEHDYEAYIEIQTCEPPTEVGFFRVGNITQPFPKCCPQKISEENTKI